MKIKQINLRKSFAATSLFVSNLGEHTIGLLTEPYHYKNKISKVNYNFDLFPDSALSQVPCAAIIAPKYFRATFMPHLSTLDIAVVFFRKQDLLLVRRYCDAKQPMIQDWMVKIMEYANHRS